MSVYTERGQGSPLADFVAENAQVLSIAAFFVGCLVFFSLGSDTFPTAANFLNVVRQAAPILVVAVAMTFVIVTAGIDLSVGSQVALVNAVAAIVLAAGYPWIPVFVLMLAFGVAVGLLQGWFIAYQGIPAFIVTLAGLSILRGFALWLTEGYSIPVPPIPGFLAFGRGAAFGVPIPALVALAVVVVGFVVLAFTKHGRVGFVQRRRRLRASGDRGGRARRHLAHGRARHDRGHHARGADHRGHRQRADPDAHLAVLHPDRDGGDHPRRHLAQHADLLGPARSATEEVVSDERSPAHVGSGRVMTVLGPIAVEDMGMTLMHEHILNDCSCWWNPPGPDRAHLADAPLTPDILWELRQDPFVNRANIALDDAAAAIEELGLFAREGGRTVVDPTCRGIGRNPAALRRIAEATGLQIVMGSGYYLQSSHPPEVTVLTAGEIADQIVAEARDGIDGARIGLVGEIGVSSDFTPDERKSLRGAAQAAVRTGLPLMVHLPGWFRLGDDVLDLAEAEGLDPARVVLCHMNPSCGDFAYQSRLAARGAFIEYDMIGMDYFYADQQVQCPDDEAAARGVLALIEAGHGDRVLLSQDVFLKMMLTRHGGNGYAFVPRHFLPRLVRHGLDPAAARALIVDNPARVFRGGR
jgi:phosphotriesterase-related protein